MRLTDSSKLSKVYQNIRHYWLDIDCIFSIMLSEAAAQARVMPSLLC